MAAIEQAILTWIHLVSAAIWVGGSLFIGIVFSPLLKTMTNSLQERMQIMIRVGTVSYTHLTLPPTPYV